MLYLLLRFPRRRYVLSSSSSLLVKSNDDDRQQRPHQYPPRVPQIFTSRTSRDQASVQGTTPCLCSDGRAGFRAEGGGERGRKSGRVN